MDIWDHGTLGPGKVETMGVCDHGTLFLGLRDHGNFELWDLGTMELWDIGTSG